MKIKAAVLREINKGYSIEELELDPPKEGEVLVKYAYAGYCHSDLSNSKGFTKMQLPDGRGSRGVRRRAWRSARASPGSRPGDHVASAWMCPCGDCPECRKGLGNICSGTFHQFVSGTMLDGTSRLRDCQGQHRPARQLRLRVLRLHRGARGRASSPFPRTCRSTGPLS